MGDSAKNLLYHQLLDTFGKEPQITNPQIQNPGQSTETFTGVNEENNERFKADAQKVMEIIKETVEKVGEPFRDANLNIPSETGQSIVVEAVKKALAEAGYSFLIPSALSLLK
ncbi:MAG: hypothetical protein AB1422_07355 [bacterium]